VHVARERGESNERLEFLGDAVIELIIREELLRRFPERSEGELTKIKSRVVRDGVLAQRAEALELGLCLLLGKGEEEEGGRKRTSVLAAAFEAMVALVFLHQGYAGVRGLVMEQFAEPLAQATEGYAQHDYKGLLQEEAHRRGARPRYSLVGTTGPPHRKEFTVQVSVAGCVQVGQGRSKKEAEQAAAQAAYEQWAGEGRPVGDA
jgi:ribonuclease-3